MSDQKPKATGTKFSQFAVTSEGPIEVVGLKGGQNVRATLTTDLVNTNPDVTFRDAKGRFRSTEDYSDLTDQLKVNRFIANELDALNEAIENIDFPEGADLSGFATKEQLEALANDSAATDNSLFKAIEEESTKTNVAVTALQIELNNVDKKSQEKDRDLQKQIDELDISDGVDLSPVEERLDDIEAVLPKAPAVIPPIDIGGQELEVTGSRPTGSGGKAGSVLMWKAEAGSGGSPYNECKLVVPDKSVIDVDAASVWWKQGDKVQRWDMGGAGWFTNTNVLHYSALETFGDTLVDGQPVELYYIDPNSAGDDLIDAISRLESKADDRKLQAEIEVLSGQLSTLVKSQEDGEWMYKGELPERPRNAGEFTLATATLTSENNSLFVFETDLGGITHNFTAPVGSYIEIVDIDDPMDYVLFEVTDEPNGTGLISIDVKLVKAGNSFDLDDRCIIRFFEVSEGLDINELDRRYLQLAGGTMKGDLNLSGTLPSIGYTDDQGQNWIQFRFGTSTEYKGWYSTDDAIATRKRVEEAVSKTVQKAERNEIAEGKFQMVWIDDSPDLPFQGRIGYQASSNDPNGMEGSFLFADGINEKTGNTAILSIGRDGDLELHGDNAIRGIGHGNQNWKPIIEGFYSIEAEKILVNGEEVVAGDVDLSGYATEEYVDQKVYQSKFLPGQQVAKVGSSSDATGAFWIVDGALYCKV